MDAAADCRLVASFAIHLPSAPARQFHFKFIEPDGLPEIQTRPTTQAPSVSHCVGVVASAGASPAYCRPCRCLPGGDALDVLVQIMLNEKAPPNARVAAANTLLDRAYGKAPTFSTSDTQAFKRAIDMTDDELAAIVAGAKLTVV